MVLRVDPFIDVWLPLLIAIVGVGGTIAVTVLQLKARRRELNDERAARTRADLEQRKEAIIAAVLDAIGPLTSAAVVPSNERTRVPFEVTAATASVVRAIRLSGRDDRDDLHAWWSVRARQFSKTKLADIEHLEGATIAEIEAWFDGRFTARQIFTKARTESSGR